MFRQLMRWGSRGRTSRRSGNLEAKAALLEHDAQLTSEVHATHETAAAGKWDPSSSQSAESPSSSQSSLDFGSSRTTSVGSDPSTDAERSPSLLGAALYLLTDAQHFHYEDGFPEESMQHAKQAVQEIVQGLRGITYDVHVMRPILVAGSVERQMMTLEADAMCLVGDLLATVKHELFGEAGASYSAILVTDSGRELPLDLPLHFTGVRDGDTLLLTRSHEGRASEDEDSESFDCCMQLWAASDSSAKAERRHAA